MTPSRPEIEVRKSADGVIKDSVKVLVQHKQGKLDFDDERLSVEP